MTQGIEPHCILITGATGAIGGALALEYAAPGRLLLLQGRNAERLAAVAAGCRARGAQVETTAFDLRERARLVDWLGDLCSHEPPDLVFVNAGVNNNIGPNGEGERWADIEALLEVNVLAAFATIDAVLPSMKARGRGQIALISSLAAYHGLPVTPSYCASKAALKVYGEALRGGLAAQGIRINVVMPGYVDSPMARAMPGPKPFQWEPERAARVIRRGLERDLPRISFPFPLNLGTWFLSVLPARSAERILRWLGYGG